MFGACSAEADACLNLTGEAASGPGLGLERGQLCSELRNCVQRTGCSGNTAAASREFLFADPVLENCYCGTAGDDCIDGAANGMCRVQVEAALETNDPVEVFQRFSGSDPAYPVFSLTQSLLECQASSQCACQEDLSCGNGIVQERPASFLREFSPCRNANSSMRGCFFEECDGERAPSGKQCDENCLVVECGNGIVQPGEECDDANDDPDDGCANCEATFECGDGVITTPFEGCDTALTPEATPLCLQSELDAGSKQLEDCGCTAVEQIAGAPPLCAWSVCGNGLVQPEVGEECEPPGEGACTNDCKLSIDACTECLSSFDIRDSEVNDGSMLCVGSAGFASEEILETIGWGCLENASCFKMWHCMQESGCYAAADEGTGGLARCYCGLDVTLADCTSPTFVPEGLCLAEISKAFEAELGAPPNNVQDLFAGFSPPNPPGFVNNTTGLPQGGSIAFTIAEQCLNRETLLNDLSLAETAGKLSDTAQACYNTCIVDL